ncbi:Stress responsive alpha-beta barrel [Spatholobus suberectus]|nr:Stress responsive alpha-beta barrel [Spatholobus suberectus]
MTPRVCPSCATTIAPDNVYCANVEKKLHPGGSVYETVVAMGTFNHFVILKFKDGVAVEELIQGLEKMVSGIEHVKSFEWGKDIESHDMLRQGFTHAFLMTFNGKEEFNAFQTHPIHVEFSGVLSPVIEKIVVLDFPSNLVKAPA